MASKRPKNRNGRFRRVGPHKPDAKIVVFSDWKALYLDGKLAAEGHSLNARDVLDALGIKHQTYSGSDEWAAYEVAQLPKDFKDVKLDERADDA